MSFEPERVVVEAVDDDNWSVVEPFTYVGRTQRFPVVAGMKTDFASVPRVFVWFLPRYGRYTLAAILHDHLWRNEAPAGRITYVEADGIFRRAMRELGVPFAKRWIMWAAVRWGALMKSGGRTGWFREAPRVLLVSVLSVPFLAPAALLVGLTLLVYQIVELLTWAPLRTSKAVREKAGRDTEKEVCAPAFEWKS